MSEIESYHVDPDEPEPQAPAEKRIDFPPFRGFVLKLGSRGEDVRTWQRQMAERGFSVVVNGVFNSMTDGVVRNFQRQVGLDVDGRIGPNTWDAAWTEL